MNLLGPAEARRQAVLKTASQFAGAGGGKKQRVETCIRRYEQHESFSDVEELHMKKILTRYGVCVLAIALMVPLAHAQGQEPTPNYDFVINDKVTNSGIEHWQVCKIDGQRKILSVT